MYRILILVSALLLAVSGMLFLQGGQTRDANDLARAPSLPDLRSATTLSAPASAPVDTAQPGSLAVALAAATNTQPADDPAMADLTAGVLAGLGAGPATPEPAAVKAAPGDDQMAALTASVLAGLGSIGAGAKPTTAAPTGVQDLRGLVSQALREGQSDAYIDMLLNEAAMAGRVVVPEALMTAEGKVDTTTLLAAIVRQAAVETDAYTEVLAAEANAGVTRAVPRPRPATTTLDGARYYVVEPGDSLAYIAMVFYGSPASYSRIYEANRDKIAGPNLIRVGQKLLIPG